MSNIVVTMDEERPGSTAPTRTGSSRIALDELERWTKLLLRHNLSVSLELNGEHVDVWLEGTRPWFEVLSLQSSVIMVDRQA